MAYTYDYPRPSLTVDCVIFGLDESARLKVLLIQRGHAPFEGGWALPGGFVDMNEPLEEAALRELKEETGLEGVNPVTLDMAPCNNIGLNSVSVFVQVGLSSSSSSCSSPKAEVLEPDKCHCWQWFDLKSMPENLFPSLQHLNQSNFIFPLKS